MLNPEQWAEVERLFVRCAELPLHEQAGFMERECSNEDLRREVASLLEHAGEGLPTAKGAIASVAASLTGDPLVGSWLGPYRVASLLGVGGMGSVYRAVREDDQFRKQVAIKVIPRVLAGTEAVARFRSERQILANLEHPGIARLLDGGTSQGVPYLVMEYVEGVPITQYARDGGLSIPERLGLMQSVCDAVQYAHRNLVIHRDLKPANILVTPDGGIKLLDFGLAKLGDPALGDPALTSRLMMTPEYASPEQVQGGPVTTASDVYSLGVILYELLTGERPYRIASNSLQEMERVICQSTPVKPSTLVSLPARTRKRLAGDLDNIVLKALEKDVSRRYGSVEQLAEDIRRHLQGLPVRARADTLIYRSGKFLKRHNTAAAAGFLVAASLVTGTVIAGREARAARERFDQVREFVRTVLVDLHGQLKDIPGTAKARQTLVTYVDDYLKRLVAQHAGDDAALATEFATTYLRLGEMQGGSADAVASFEKGGRLLERRGRNGAPAPGDRLLLAWLRARAGSVLVDLGRAPEGAENLQSAIALAGKLSQPKIWNRNVEQVRVFAEWRLARLYRAQYRLPEAAEHAGAAIAAGEEILRHGQQTAEDYQTLTGARHTLGGVLLRQGHWQQSMEMYEKALADTEQRAAANPGSAGLQRELARCHWLLSDMMDRAPGHGRSELRLHVRSAIAIAERLAAADPSDKTAQIELGEYLSDGADELSRPEETREALSYLRRAMQIFRSLREAELDNADLQLYEGLSEAQMGKLLGRKNPSRESILWIRRGLADLTKLAATDPKNTVHQFEVIKVERWLVDNLARSGEEKESMALAQDGIVKSKSVAGDMRASPDAWRELPRAYATMAATCRTFGRQAEARQWYRAAFEAWQKMRANGYGFPESAAEIEQARKGAGI